MADLYILLVCLLYVSSLLYLLFLVLQCTASTARMCIYGLLSFVVTSFEEDTLGSQQVTTLSYFFLFFPFFFSLFLLCKKISQATSKENSAKVSVTLISSSTPNGYDVQILSIR